MNKENQFTLIGAKGLLPKVDPIVVSNNVAFNAMSKTAEKLPMLVKEGRVVSCIQEEFNVNIDEILESGDKALIASAHSMIVAISHAYEVEAGKSAQGEPVLIPERLSTHLVALSNAVGVPPTHTYQAYILQNYYLIDPNKGFSLDNLSSRFTYTDTVGEKHFVKIHLMCEYYGGKILESLEVVSKIIQSGEASAFPYDVYMRNYLEVANDNVNRMTDTLKSMNSVLDPEEFFFQLRPLLKNYAHGVIFEHDTESKAVDYRGASGAQSTIIPLVDKMMGYSISQEEVMKDMLNYMPKEHVKYLDHIKPVIRDHVIHSGDSELIRLYNEITESTATFRSTHYFEIIVPYIVKNVAGHFAGGISGKFPGIDKGTLSNQFIESFNLIKSYFIKNANDFSNMKSILDNVNTELLDLIPTSDSCDTVNQNNDSYELTHLLCEMFINTKETDVLENILDNISGFATKTFGTAGMDFAHQLQSNILDTRTNTIGEVDAEIEIL